MTRRTYITLGDPEVRVMVDVIEDAKRFDKSLERVASTFENRQRDYFMFGNAYVLDGRRVDPRDVKPA